MGVWTFCLAAVKTPSMCLDGRMSADWGTFAAVIQDIETKKTDHVVGIAIRSPMILPAAAGSDLPKSPGHCAHTPSPSIEVHAVKPGAIKLCNL
jgi:hypothetical protein